MVRRPDRHQVPLLTIASCEGDGGSETWIPEGEQMPRPPRPLGEPDGNFARIDITGGNNLQPHVCPASPDHPHIELLQ
ncbi:hypothetical protein [Streptomyces sp. NPDC058751]|uniref:hypothetical protein n=1 Tax=Streptomyces sp. NPDC058751 TaxID=3346623 RepID=UPI0036A79777